MGSLIPCPVMARGGNIFYSWQAKFSTISKKDTISLKQSQIFPSNYQLVTARTFPSSFFFNAVGMASLAKSYGLYEKRAALSACFWICQLNNLGYLDNKVVLEIIKRTFTYCFDWPIIFTERVHIRLWPLSSQLVHAFLVTNNWSKWSQHKTYDLLWFVTGAWIKAWTGNQWLLTSILSVNIFLNYVATASSVVKSLVWNLWASVFVNDSWLSGLFVYCSYVLNVMVCHGCFSPLLNLIY